MIVSSKTVESVVYDEANETLELTAKGDLKKVYSYFGINKKLYDKLGATTNFDAFMKKEITNKFGFTVS